MPSTVSLIACAIPAVIVEFAIIIAGVPTPAAMVVTVILLIALLIALDAGNHVPGAVSKSDDRPAGECQGDANVGGNGEVSSTGKSGGPSTDPSTAIVNSDADASTATADQAGEGGRRNTRAPDAGREAR